MNKLSCLLVMGLFALLCFTQCSRPDQKTPVFRPDTLTPFTAEIDINRDTTLHAPEGSLIQIPAHTLSAGGATRVRLVIREALRMSDIIHAGLVTTSDGKALSSGGMIDIEAAEDQTITITGPITVKLPTPYLANNMQVFKGVPGANGNLNWQDPQPMTPEADSAVSRLNNGQSIFTNNCASCHALHKVLIAPELAYISQRRDRKWLYSFTKNNYNLLAAGDRFANCLYEQYNKTPMNVFPGLTDTALDDLYAYINNESTRLRLPHPDDHIKHCVDSCIKRDSLSSPDYTAPALQYYQFTIQKFGWYNIDCFLHQTDGVITSELMVRIRKEYREVVNIYLVIPSAQVVQEGHSLDNEDGPFGFYSPDGKISLPKDIKAIILALGEKDGQPLMGTSTFRVSEKQTIDLDIHPFQKDKLEEYLHQLDMREWQPSDMNTDKNIPQQAPGKNTAPATPLRDTAQFALPKCDCSCGLPKKI